MFSKFQDPRWAISIRWKISDNKKVYTKERKHSKNESASINLFSHNIYYLIVIHEQKIRERGKVLNSLEYKKMLLTFYFMRDRWEQNITKRVSMIFCTKICMGLL